MGRSALRDAITTHKGWVTAGMVAHHLGFCADGTAAFMQSHRITPGPQPAREVTDTLGGWLRNEYDLPDDPDRCRYVASALPSVATSATPRGFSGTYKRWNDVLARDVLTNTEVTYLGHRLSEVLGGGHQRSKLTRDEAEDLFITTLYRHRVRPYRLTDEQTRKGIAWLRRNDVLKELRALSYHDGERVAEVATEVESFEFAGYWRRDTGNYYRPGETFSPMYRAIAPSGSFTYTAFPWVQNCGRLVVHNTDFSSTPL